jgi:uncharacterized phage infection (PIP) family protein YhgE
MPLFMMAMIGFIYPSNGTTVSNLPVALVNEDLGSHKLHNSQSNFHHGSATD